MQGYVMVWDEPACIQRARLGDEAAFEAIYQRYEKQIYALVYRMMGNPEDAYDLTQECFLRAYSALPRTSEDLNLSAWLHRIASNACLDALRRRTKIKWIPWDIFTADGAYEPAAPDNPERTLIRRELRQEVQEILNRLQPKHRLCLLLREYQGLSCEEIASVMGSTRAAVKSMLFRAREEFRRVYLAAGKVP